MQLAWCGVVVNNPAESNIAQAQGYANASTVLLREDGRCLDWLDYSQSKQTHCGREMHLSEINAVRYVFSLLSKQLLLHEFLAINVEVFHVNSDLKVTVREWDVLGCSCHWMTLSKRWNPVTSVC